MTREEEIQKAAEEHISNCPNRDVTEGLLALSDFYAGAKWADAHPAKKHSVTIDARVARDENNLISLYEEKPSKKVSFYVGRFWALLREEDFPSVTFENSPKKVKVTIELEEEL